MLGFHSTSNNEVEQASSDEEEQTSYYDDVHTADNPTCPGVNCWCHTDWQYHAVYIQDQEFGEPTDEQYQTALSILGGG
jgi:hypothetical protein